MALIKRISPLLIVVLLSSFAIFPFFQSGFFPMHDDTQPARVFEMAKSLQNGMFPVRWVFDLGYGAGYPIFNFYAPLAYYFGAIFVLIGFDALIATKIMMATGILISGIFMYLFAKNIWGELGGVVSALFYMYAPYHAVNIFVRGAVSEFWAYAFIPLVFYSLNKVYKKVSIGFTVLGVFSYAGIILSHNLTAVMITPVIFGYIIALSLISLKNKKKIYLYFLTVIFGIITSMFYWLPALIEMKNTNIASQFIGGSDFRKNFVCLGQLWNSPWGFGGSIAGCTDGMSFVLGKPQISIALFSALLLIWLLYKKVKSRKVLFSLLTFISLVISIFLTLEISKPIWESIYTMSYFQYPWRFLNLAMFFLSILAGFLVWGIRSVFKKNQSLIQIVASTILIIFLFFLNFKYFTPQKIVRVTSADYTSENILKWKISKISDEYLPKNFIKPKNMEDALRNKRIFSFAETPIERTSDIISMAGIIVLIIVIIFSRKKRTYE